MMIRVAPLALIASYLTVASVVDGFTTPPKSSAASLPLRTSSVDVLLHPDGSSTYTVCRMGRNTAEEDPMKENDQSKRPRRRHLRNFLSAVRRRTTNVVRRPLKHLKPIALGILTVAATEMMIGTTTISDTTTTATTDRPSIVAPTVRPANAGVYSGRGRLLPRKYRGPDFNKRAENKVAKLLDEKHKKDLLEYAEQVRTIERTQGPKARARFERKARRDRLIKKAEKKIRLKQLKYDLLREGIDPVHDNEGRQKIFKYNTGYDLADFDRTREQTERMAREEGVEYATFRFRRMLNREIIRLIVQNLLDRGIDPVLYYDRNPQVFREIQKESFKGKQHMFERIDEVKKNIELYMSPEAPRAGEMSVKEEMEKYPERFKKKIKEPIRSLNKVRGRAIKKAQREEERLKEDIKAGKTLDSLRRFVKLKDFKERQEEAVKNALEKAQM